MRITINLNISQIRALLRRYNHRKLSHTDNMRCKKFDVELEQALAGKEVEAVENKFDYYCKEK